MAADQGAASRFVLRKFLRHPLFAFRYRRDYGGWPLIWLWEVDTSA